MVDVPYDNVHNGGNARGGYELGAGGADGRCVRPCTVRIAEILSLRRLIYEGKMLDNCLEVFAPPASAGRWFSRAVSARRRGAAVVSSFLAFFMISLPPQDRYDSQLKYVLRARQRTSSFWSLTFTYPAAEQPAYAMLFEAPRLLSLYIRGTRLLWPPPPPSVLLRPCLWLGVRARPHYLLADRRLHLQVTAMRPCLSLIQT